MSEQPDKAERDRVIADSGWGIKPDDQPSNSAERGEDACRTYRYDASEPDIVRKILRAQRKSFNTANRVRVEGGADGGRTIIFDINKDGFIVEGLSYGDPNLVPLLECLGAAFNAPELRRLTRDEQTPREFALSRAWAWGAERTG